jgi:hypothetical protein
MKAKKFFITETGKAEILNTSICPICGAARDNNLDRWDYISNVFNKSPLTCGHGYWITENMNTTDDAANDDWQEAVLIRPEFIQELEALGYSEATE